MHYLAQLNLARWAIPADDPLRAEFESLLDDVNAAAERAHGFLWRLEGDEGDASSFDFLNDPEVIVNLSVWQSWKALKAFTYTGDHLPVFRRRSDWFESATDPMLVLWWIPAGHVPDLEEAGDRLLQLRRDGATPQAFTPAHRFPATESDSA